MTKEFNLKEKRISLFLLITKKIPRLAKIFKLIERAVEKQDKEFIRLLKEEIKDQWFGEEGIVSKDIIRKIDKLAGIQCIQSDIKEKVK